MLNQQSASAPAAANKAIRPFQRNVDLQFTPREEILSELQQRQTKPLRRHCLLTVEASKEGPSVSCGGGQELTATVLAELTLTRLRRRCEDEECNDKQGSPEDGQRLPSASCHGRRQPAGQQL